MPEPKQPLTDKQIRQEFEAQKNDLIRLSLDLLAFQYALLDKKILTPEDMLHALQKVTREGKEAIARVVSSTHNEPSGGVQ